MLFVDDEERILNALRTLFRGQYHVFTAENGALALEFVKRFGIHVVVSDQRMPGMTGVELLRQVKELSPNSVRMLLTGYSDLAAIVGSINEGEVFRFVKKPWDNDEMQKTIADAVAIALELAVAPPAPAAPPEKLEASILVIDSSDALAEGLKSVLGDVAPIRHVASTDDAREGPGGRGGRAHRGRPLRGPGRAHHALQAAQGRAPGDPVDPRHRGLRFRAGDRAHQPGADLPLPQQAHPRAPAARPRRGGAREVPLVQAARPTSCAARRPSRACRRSTSLWGAKLFERIRSLPDRLFARS